MSASFRPFLAETRKGLYITIKLIDKLQFTLQFGVERRRAAICPMQCVTHCPRALPAKLKFVQQ